MSCKPLSSVSIVRVDMSNPNEVEIKLPVCDSIWLPYYVSFGGQSFVNPNYLSLLVRFPSGPTQLVWAISNGYQNAMSGRFSSIFVQPNVGSVANNFIYLLCGSNVELGWANGDGLSPAIGRFGSSVTAGGVSL